MKTFDIKNYKPTVLKYEGNIKDGYTVLIYGEKTNFKTCLDVYKDSFNDIVIDWNQYIFNTNNSIDIFKKKMQNNSEITNETFNLVLTFLENKNLI